jgi:alcohol dehydrogenase
VFGCAAAGVRYGSVGEYCILEENAAALKPASIPHDQACCLGVAPLTSWRCMTWRGKLQKGQKMFITAGAGGVGTFAIQQATKIIGASVTVTCSAAKADFCKSLGAEICVDYKTEKFEEKLKDYDLAIDATEEYNKMFNILKPGGTLVSITAPPQTISFEEFGDRKPNCCILCCLDCCSCGVRRTASSKKVNFYPLILLPHDVDLAEMAKQVEDGKMKVIIDKTYPMDQAMEALQYLESGKATGKVVVRVQDEPKSEEKKQS